MFDFTANAVQMAMSAEGTPIFKPLYWLFGVCMEFLLSVLNNQYFVAIIIFTVLTRLVLLPANLHQQKATAKTARLTPKIQKIQKKYPDPKDRNKLNQEMNDLYAREGHNPMQMGCGPLIFQLVFLMGIVGIIYYPLSYIIGISNIATMPTSLQNSLKVLIIRATIFSSVYLKTGLSIKISLLLRCPNSLQQSVLRILTRSEAVCTSRT